MAAPSRFFVHAEFTISHPGANDPENLPKTSTERQDEGVKMTYTWKTQDDDVQAWDSASNRSGVSDNVRRPSPTATRPFPDVRGGPGLQRGNMLFTSTPPLKNSPAASEVSRRFVQDSGYGSDLLSPTGGRGKCRSTCNITLSSSRSCPSQRTQSLRCQTPTSTRSASSFYGCGDPWCHHLRPCDDVRFTPLLEEDTCITGGGSRKPSRASTFTAADANTKKDVSVQTFEMVDKCTSPFMRTDSFRYLTEMNDYNRSPQPYSARRRAFATSGGTRKQFGTLGKPVTESVSSLTPDSLENYKPSKKLTRSPGLKRLPAIDRTLKEISPASDSKSTSDSQKKPRTVHIDVYCTGTELESSSSEESSDSKTASTPQTVFESDKLRVTHKKASEEELPFYLRKKFNSQVSEAASKPIKPEQQPSQNDSDNDDNISTSYPSKLSSYSTIRDFSESVSSVPWTNYSMSSFTLPDENDSVCNSSWKDTTFSDVDSFLHNSKSSIDHTESLDFVPRRLYEKNASIDETPEYERKDLLETPSVDSLQPSDSFEYANSEDRLRIKRMEEMWKSRHWKSPQTLLQQQKKMQEYMEKKIQDKKAWKEKSKDSSDESDTSEKGWAIVKESSKENKNTIGIDKTKRKQEAFKSKEDQGILSDSSPTRQSPSGQVSKQRYSLDPNLRSPFTITPGIYTEPRKIATKFGSIVNFLKKPGHHVGPARNPDCTCDHCQSYWDKVGRNRTRSMGDAPTNMMVNWKEFRNKQAE